MPEEAERPGRLGYWIALTLVAVGLVLFVAAVVPAMRAVSAGVEGLDRFVVEGTGPVGFIDAAAAGRVLVHYEPITEVGGESFATETTWEPVLSLTDASGASVELVPTSSTVVYRRNGRAGHSLVEAELPAAGRYALVVTEPGLAGEVADGSIGPAAERPRVLAVGAVPVKLLKDGLVGVYGGAVALGLLGCAASIIALITWARRHGTKTERVDGQPTAWA